VVLGAGAGAGGFVAGVVTYVMPREFESLAVVQAMPRIPRIVVTRGVGEPAESAGKPARAAATELEEMRSGDFLGQVVESLELDQRWGMDKKTAVAKLGQILTLADIKGTGVISIRARSANPEDAWDIATEVVKGYKAYRGRLDEEDTQRMLDVVNTALREQEDRVEEKRKVLNTIIWCQGIDNQGTKPADRPADSAGKEGMFRECINGSGFDEAMRESKDEEDLLRTMKAKEMEIKKEIAAPISFGGVVVHEEPVLPRSPVSPNVGLNLTCGTVLGALVSSLLALPVVWLLNRLKPVKG